MGREIIPVNDHVEHLQKPGGLGEVVGGWIDSDDGVSHAEEQTIQN